MRCSAYRSGVFVIDQNMHVKKPAKAGSLNFDCERKPFAAVTYMPAYLARRRRAVPTPTRPMPISAKLNGSGTTVAGVKFTDKVELTKS